MKLTTFLFAIALLATACKKKDTATGTDCSKVVDHSMELSKGAMGVDEAMAKKMRDLGAQHCKDDNWSEEARKCMADAKTMSDSQACYGKLTQEQQDKMNNAAMALQAPPAGSAGSAPAPTEGSAPPPAADGSGSSGSAPPK